MLSGTSDTRLNRSGWRRLLKIPINCHIDRSNVILIPYVAHFPWLRGLLRFAISCRVVRSCLISITFKRIRTTCSRTNCRDASLGKDVSLAASRTNSAALSSNWAAVFKSSIAAVIYWLTSKDRKLSCKTEAERGWPEEGNQIFLLRPHGTLPVNVGIVAGRGHRSRSR